jgi:inosose dehydratase
MNLTRREVVFATAATFLPFPANRETGSSSSRLSVEGYIWQQYMAGKGKKLGDGLDEIFAMARSSGFHNIELNTGFLTDDLRDRVLELIQTNGLSMPSVYVGGAMHDEKLADVTIAHSLEIARFCKRVGCKAIVGDPSPKQGQAEKTDAELAVQAAMLDMLGKALAAEGFQFWVHNHDAEMVNNAKEWWNTLNHTDPSYVWMCMDLDWVHQGDEDPLALLRAAGKRVACLHLRNSKQKLWLESLDDGDIDYRKVAAYLKSARLQPLLMVELAYRPQTTITRSLEEDLRLSRVYAEHIFKVKG